MEERRKKHAKGGIDTLISGIDIAENAGDTIFVIDISMYLY